ncbi:hypothetical protein PVAP13_5NG476272 [Panicum virgatum]|uniref:Uncharacterized protein n=1 Tax=Panicum virgatum TaxID=38727 RepID=A0A8T0S282_PANVG|nr:hypothetical protein PVAP13_5NG476272 [Panicum virgatum]
MEHFITCTFTNGGLRVYNLNHQFGIFPLETEFQNILLRIYLIGIIQACLKSEQLNL